MEHQPATQYYTFETQQTEVNEVNEVKQIIVDDTNGSNASTDSNGSNASISAPEAPIATGVVSPSKLCLFDNTYSNHAEDSDSDYYADNDIGYRQAICGYCSCRTHECECGNDDEDESDESRYILCAKDGTCFKERFQGHLTMATQYVIYLIINGSDRSNELTREHIAKWMSSLDFYTFNWKCLPKEIFTCVFRCLSRERLIYFVGYFRCWDKGFESENDESAMIDALYNHFQQK